MWRPTPLLLTLAPFPEMPYRVWLGPNAQICPEMHHSTEAKDSWLQQGAVQGFKKGHTLTNFLSIFALMSLARVKNACGISMSLMSLEQGAERGLPVLGCSV